jgi:hypothetical protein
MLLALAALLAVAPLCVRADSIKLPPSFPSRKDTIDTTGPYKLVPINKWLAAEPDVRPLALNLRSESLTPEVLSEAAGYDFSCYRMVIFQEDFGEGAEANLVALGDIIQRIRRQGREVMLTLDSVGLDTPSYLAFFQRIYDAVGADVKYFQFLDNLNRHLGVSSYTYHELLGSIRQLRTDSGRDFTIVAGGIQGIDYKFIQDLADAYVFDRVDVIAFNLYPDAEHMEYPLRRAEVAPHSLNACVEMIGKLARYGKPVFITDLGVSTAYAPLGVSQLEQASMLCRASLYLLQGGVSRVFLHSLVDTESETLNARSFMGLYNLDASPKPSAGAVRRLAWLLRASYFIEPYYLFQMNNEFPAENAPVFAYHIYRPAENAVYFTYVTTDMMMLDRSTNLVIYRTDMQAQELLNLLTGTASPSPCKSAGNLLLFNRLPLSHVPVAVKLQLEAHGG